MLSMTIMIIPVNFNDFKCDCKIVRLFYKVVFESTYF